MIRLFKYEGYKMVIEPEALLLKPFKQIWQRDRSQNKDKAMMELGFIYFFCDPRSDYQYLTDEEQRKQAIKEGEGLPEKWEPDKVVLDAMEFYNSFKPTSALLLEDTRFAVDKLRKLLREIDLTQTDDKGKPIYTLNTITATIKQVPSLVKDLDDAEKAIAKESMVAGKMRGQGEKTIMEDGLNIEYMKAEDIIEGLNQSIEDKRDALKIKATGHLVLQRTVKPHQTFKAYKEYESVVWFVKDGKKYRVIRLTWTAKVLDGQEETVLREINIRLSRLIFNWIGSSFYEQVIKGEYNGYTDEQISHSYK